jgi:hypothetical protein
VNNAERLNAERLCADLSEELTIRVIDAVPDWVRRCVDQTLDVEWRRTRGEWRVEHEDEILRRAEAAGWAAARVVGRAMRSLLATGDGVGSTSPLEIVRDAVTYPTTVLSEAGVAAVQRSPDRELLFPHDVYDLTPRTLADLHPLLPELAHRWEEARAAIRSSREDS